ncbi:MAG TPA: response regulator [Polyangia bacterium]|nr:response regulator [Polyangia bacterium]
MSPAYSSCLKTSFPESETSTEATPRSWPSSNSANPSAPSALAAPAAGDEETIASDTVLVVEDDPDIREMVLTLLTLAGFIAVAAADGYQALSYLGAHALPAVILLDWRMPRCDGPQFRALQLQDPRLRSIPVILFSSEERCHEKAVALEAAGWLPKSARPRQLLRAIAPYAVRRAGFEHRWQETLSLETSL